VIQPDQSQITISRNPATGVELGRFAVHDSDHVLQVVNAARAAHRQWGSVPVRQRVAHLRAVCTWFADHADELALTISRENGKTRIDAMAAEVAPAAMAVDYYCRHAPRLLRDRSVAAGNIVLANKRTRVVRVPYGVVGVISPWNYPLSIPFSEVVMALLAGNAVVLKGASVSQGVTRAIVESLDAASLPVGLFACVNMPGPTAARALLDAGIDKLFFTGSTASGKQLMAEAARTLTPLVLELGGKDPALVCEDADVHRAAAGIAWAGLQNCGQSCNGVERVYVHERVYHAFLAALKPIVEGLRVGCGQGFDVEMGVMTTEAQLRTVRAQMHDALTKGARIHAQSPTPSDSSLCSAHPAVVLVDVTTDMLVMREETFGPLLPVVKVASMDEAVALANDSEYGLTASVWSRNASRADALARRLCAGVVMVNDHGLCHGMSEVPFGGFKQSGFGRTHGGIGFDEMTQVQAIVRDILPGVKRSMWWYPHSQAVHDAVRGGIDALYARGIARRLRGLVRLARLAPRYFR